MSKNYGVLASILLSQAAYESNYGSSLLSVKYHNIYSLPARPGQEHIYLKDNVYSKGKWQYQKVDFAVFRDWSSSMSSYLEELRQGRRMLQDSHQHCPQGKQCRLVARTYDKYILWTDSVKALTAQDELNVLKKKYDESLATIQEKDDSLSAKQYIIIGLCTLVAILVATIIVLAILLLKFITGNRKLKKSVVIANEHNELKTKFIRNISSQMEPTLNTLGLPPKSFPPKLQGMQSRCRHK